MRLDAHTLGQPLGDARGLRIHGAGHDAEARTAVDLFQPIENGPQERLVRFHLVAPHVVDRQDDHGLHTLLADPLWRDEPREVDVHVVRINGTVEIREAIAGVGGPSLQDDRGPDHERLEHVSRHFACLPMVQPRIKRMATNEEPTVPHVHN